MNANGKQLHSNTRSESRFARLAALAGLVSLAGCATPPYEAPPTVAAIETAAAYHADSGTATSAAQISATASWWRSVGGDDLDSLVRTLLAQSLDLEIARARIEQSEALRRQARGAQLPAVDASLGISETRSQGDEFGSSPFIGGVGGGGSNFASFGTDTYSAALNVNWDVDIFGELRRGTRAAELSLTAAQLRETATAQTLVSQLARAWVELGTLQRRVELQRNIADSFRTTADLTDQRYRNGSDSTTAADVEIARSNHASAQARLPELEFQLARQAIAIDTLLGRLPGTTFDQLDNIRLPDELDQPPVGMPADLMTRRPDVAAAELEFRAALEDIGAARARLFPGLSLTSSLTFRGQDTDAFDWDSHVATLASSLLAPIFQGGRLRAQVRASEAVARELAASYSATALAAVADVETALLAESAFSSQTERYTENVRAAALADELSQNRYRQGLSTLLRVLEAQRSLNTARESLILAEQQRLLARIDLYQALGGNWMPDANNP